MIDKMSKLPPNVKTVARLAGGLGIVQSFVWVLLGSLALASYLNCGFAEDPEESLPTDFIPAVLHRYFFLNDYCENYESLDGIVSSYELHVWAAAAVATSSLWLIISCCMLIFVTNKNMSSVNIVLYSWSTVALIVSSTDIALGIVLGISYSTVGDLMNDYSTDINNTGPSLIVLMAIRTGAMGLMVVAFRGFVLVVINLSLVVLLLYYAYLVNAAINRSEHNVHSMGPLHAYQGSKNQPDPWSTMGIDYDTNGAQVNRGYSRSEHERERDWNQAPPPQLRRPDNRDDTYYGRSLTRSDSWHRAKAMSQPPKPFSYLEEPRQQPQRAPSPGPLASPSAIPPWKRRDNIDSGPIVPSPDYSPPQNRRLKSALKPTAY